MGEVDAIFDAFAGLSEQIHRQDALNRKVRQIQSVTSKKCGNCAFWMTTHCKPEKVHKQFKSMESTGCSDFNRCSSSVNLEVQFIKELKET